MVKTAKILGKKNVKRGRHVAELKIKEVVDEVTGESYKGVDQIGSPSLTSVIIPPCADLIGYDGFYNCSKLTKVTIYGNRVIQLPGGKFTLPGYYDETNEDWVINSDLVIRVPNSMVDAYKANAEWSELADHIVGF